MLAGRRKRAAAVLAAEKPLTLGDRLRPLVDGALAGTLAKGQQAELERLLIGYWRERLKLEGCAPAEFMPLLRDHAEAGPLISRLEDWLHRPAGTAEPVDLNSLLEPYQAIAADAFTGELSEVVVAGSVFGRGGPLMSFAYPAVLVLLAASRAARWPGSGSGRPAASRCRSTTAATIPGGSGRSCWAWPNRCRR